MQAVGKVGKRMVLYPPRELLEKLGFSEGCDVVFRVEGDRLVVEKVENLWELALRSRKWAETSVEEFERESEEVQGEFAFEEEKSGS
ncbi:MAG: AbrB/MazE/SpoVT family DNA-binding domain-containing protein [Candidatus Jordarchaeales archaeon]